jgi:hypothetical protein
MWDFDFRVDAAALILSSAMAADHFVTCRNPPRHEHDLGIEAITQVRPEQPEQSP